MLTLMQSSPQPGEIPWYVAALVVPFAAWFGAAVWPVIVKRWQGHDMIEAKRVEEERAWQRGLEERRVRADEQTAQALETIGKTQIVIDLRLQLIERHLGLETEPEVQARARKPVRRRDVEQEGER